MIRPPCLKPGDTVATVSLSWGGPGALPHRYEAGKRQLEEALGLRVVETEHALADPDFLEAHPELRASDLMAAFRDPEIAGVISTIGGEDSVRILPYLDLAVLRAHPKVFCGFSDTTVTHFACFAAGLVSFYGPSILAGFGENGGPFPYMLDSFKRTVMTPEPAGPIEVHEGGWTAEFLDWAVPENQSVRRKLNPAVPHRWISGTGRTSGRLIGGCIEALEFIKGTEVWPSLEVFEGAVLFLETSEEAPSPLVVRRWLRHYGSLGILQVVSALLFGRPGGNVPEERFAEYDAMLLGIVRDELGLDLPIVTCLDFGHTSPMCVLPLGVDVEVDCDRRRVAILEKAVEG